jgi:hypothetical protein
MVSSHSQIAFVLFFTVLLPTESAVCQANKDQRKVR